MNAQSPPSIAFQGEPGAYSEEAARGYFGAEAITLPCDTFAAVFAAVEEGDADRGLIPIENSVAGSIHRNYDLLLRHQLKIIGETHLRIRHCLMALPGVALEAIEQVHSHPQALAQCERFLSGLADAEVVAAYDTAGSARAISRDSDRTRAAIASRRAAQVYGLEILAAGIEDDPSNFTRFLALDRERADPGADAKSSVVFSLDNEPGALYRALSVFAEAGIDLTKIESRPLVGKPWEYFFYLDLAGSREDSLVGGALAELESMATMYRLLGSYPRERWTQEGEE